MVQLLITDAGPAPEICPSNLQACTWVESSPALCFILPCSKSMFSGEETVHQPAWAEPNLGNLIDQMKRLYAERYSIEGRKKFENMQLAAHIRQRTWFNTGTAMLLRLRALLEAQG